MARNAPSVDAYGDGGFRLSGARHEGSVLIVQDQARPWSVRSLAELTPESLAEVIALGPREVEFVLLGVGLTNAQPPRPVREALARAGIGLEFMDTATAARTYNLLTAEGRRLAAALIAI
ncbi:Mth938-like domain-containing protein [Phenylobacterium aquaticum]|uniref:Mth938-like domain-containing protein n=1 Tax=Phenylobacterium aquaticum TaxID=1763816 RepID=UPI0026F25704|nr:Mth938-like domain-containing protein [Phenylobacterium aquaticum]